MRGATHDESSAVSYSSGAGGAVSASANTSTECRRVKCYVRVRPLTHAELAAGSPEGSHGDEGVVDGRISCVSAGDDGKSICLQHGSPMVCDGVFLPETPLMEIGEVLLIQHVRDVLDGYHSALLLYGQTGSGKTYTINQLLPAFVRTLFAVSESERLDYETSVSMECVQIYLERVSDLIDPQRVNLQIREFPDTGVYVRGATERPIASPGAFLEVWEAASARRVTSATRLNPVSSRSHCIVQLRVQRRKLARRDGLSAPPSLNDTTSAADAFGDAAGPSRGGQEPVVSMVTCGKVYFVDLAGSERLKASQSEGLRQAEAIHINQSLSTLGNVMSALSNPKATHVPYRDSKLTRLLQESLGGGGSSAVVVCISPWVGCLAESHHSLQFGKRAMEVVQTVTTWKEIDGRARLMEVQEWLEQRVHLLEGQVRAMKAENRRLRESHEGRPDDTTRVLEEASDGVSSDADAPPGPCRTCATLRVELQLAQSDRAIAEQSLAAACAEYELRLKKLEASLELANNDCEYYRARRIRGASGRRSPRQPPTVPLATGPGSDEDGVAPGLAHERKLAALNDYWDGYVKSLEQDLANVVRERDEACKELFDMTQRQQKAANAARGAQAPPSPVQATRFASGDVTGAGTSAAGVGHTGSNEAAPPRDTKSKNHEFVDRVVAELQQRDRTIDGLQRDLARQEQLLSTLAQEHDAALEVERCRGEQYASDARRVKQLLAEMNEKHRAALEHATCDREVQLQRLQASEASCTELQTSLNNLERELVEEVKMHERDVAQLYAEAAARSREALDNHNAREALQKMVQQLTSKLAEAEAAAEASHAKHVHCESQLNQSQRLIDQLYGELEMAQQHERRVLSNAALERLEKQRREVLWHEECSRGQLERRALEALLRQLQHAAASACERVHELEACAADLRASIEEKAVHVSQEFRDAAERQARDAVQSAAAAAALHRRIVELEEQLRAASDENQALVRSVTQWEVRFRDERDRWRREHMAEVLQQSDLLQARLQQWRDAEVRLKHEVLTREEQQLRLSVQLEEEGEAGRMGAAAAAEHAEVLRAEVAAVQHRSQAALFEQIRDLQHARARDALWRDEVDRRTSNQHANELRRLVAESEVTVEQQKQRSAHLQRCLADSERRVVDLLTAEVELHFGLAQRELELLSERSTGRKLDLLVCVLEHQLQQVLAELEATTAARSSLEVVCGAAQCSESMSTDHVETPGQSPTALSGEPSADADLNPVSTELPKHRHSSCDAPNTDVELAGIVHGDGAMPESGPVSMAVTLRHGTLAAVCSEVRHLSRCFEEWVAKPRQVLPGPEVREFHTSAALRDLSNLQQRVAVVESRLSELLVAPPLPPPPTYPPPCELHLRAAPSEMLPQVVDGAESTASWPLQGDERPLWHPGEEGASSSASDGSPSTSVKHLQQQVRALEQQNQRLMDALHELVSARARSIADLCGVEAHQLSLASHPRRDSLTGGGDGSDRQPVAMVDATLPLNPARPAAVRLGSTVCVCMGDSGGNAGGNGSGRRESAREVREVGRVRLWVQYALGLSLEHAAAVNSLALDYALRHWDVSLEVPRLPKADTEAEENGTYPASAAACSATEPPPSSPPSRAEAAHTQYHPNAPLCGTLKLRTATSSHSARLRCHSVGHVERCEQALLVAQQLNREASPISQKRAVRGEGAGSGIPSCHTHERRIEQLSRARHQSIRDILRPAPKEIEPGALVAAIDQRVTERIRRWM